MNKFSVTALAAGAAVLVGGGAYIATQDEAAPLTASVGATSEPKLCGDFGIMMTDGECFAAGTIRFVSLYNLQGGAQFCNWQKANPGEWTRLKAFAETETLPANIITWNGSHIKNDLEAYFATGAPTFTIQPNTAPNRCKTPLAPPIVTGVTPGETDATVTVTTTP